MFKRLCRICTLIFLLVGLAAPAHADFIGLKAGGGVWDFEPSGTFRYLGNDIDLKDDLKLKDEQQTYTFVVLEHPIPLIPNIKFSKTNLTTSGGGTLTASYTFGGTTYNVSDTVTTEMDLSHSDVTLYYELLDNIISLDLGLTGKMFDGKVEVTRAGVTTSTKVDGTIPMVYAALGLSIPATGLSLVVEGSTLSVGDNSLSDVTTKISYESDYFLGVEAGVRAITLELDDLDSNYSNMKFSGMFANLFLHF